MVGLGFGYFCLQGLFFFFSFQDSIPLQKHSSESTSPVKLPSNSYCYKSVIKDVFSRVWHTDSTQMGTAKALQFYHKLQNTWREKRCPCREHQHKRSFVSWGHEDLRFDQDGGKKDKCLDTILEKISQAGGQSHPGFHGLMAKQKEPLMNYHLIWSILRILQCPTGDYLLGGTYQTTPRVSGPTESCPKLSLSIRLAASQTSNLSLQEKYKLK